jgi:hypothetical protein
MFGHVGRRTTVLTPERQTLQHAQRNQDHRGRNADAGIVRQDTHDERGQAHDQDGHQEGVLAADHVAQAAEHQCAEWAHDEAGREREQGEDEGRASIKSAEELLGNDGGERAVKVKVVPLEHGAERGGEDDLLLLRGHRPCCHGCCL